MSLVRLFEAKELAAALSESGHQVSPRTVQRWKSGEKDPKPQDLAAIHRLLQHEEAAPPQWAERLEAKLDSIQKIVESNADDLVSLRAILEATRGRVPQSHDDQEDGPSPVQPEDKRGR